MEVVERVVQQIGFDGFEARVVVTVQELLNNKVKENGNWEIYETTLSNKDSRVIGSRFKRFKAVLARVYNRPFKAEIDGKILRVVVRK